MAAPRLRNRIDPVFQQTAMNKPLPEMRESLVRDEEAALLEKESRFCSTSKIKRGMEIFVVSFPS